MSAAALLTDAERVTEDLLQACDRGTATIEEILHALDVRERLLRQLQPGTAPSPEDRAAADRLRALDIRLEAALHGKQRAVQAQLAKATRQPQPQPASGRLVHESA